MKYVALIVIQSLVIKNELLVQCIRHTKHYITEAIVYVSLLL
jgi:hypothetical protein